MLFMNALTYRTLWLVVLLTVVALTLVSLLLALEGYELYESGDIIYHKLVRSGSEQTVDVLAWFERSRFEYQPKIVA